MDKKYHDKIPTISWPGDPSHPRFFPGGWQLCRFTKNVNNQTESEKGIEWYISAPSFLNSCEWLLLYGHSIQKLHSFKVINYRETILHTCPLYFSGRSHILYVQNWGHHISFISCGLKRGSAFLRWQTFLTFDSNNSVWWFNQNMDINHFCSFVYLQHYVNNLCYVPNPIQTDVC